jgi:hypothetical protein
LPWRPRSFAARRRREFGLRFLWASLVAPLGYNELQKRDFKPD